MSADGISDWPRPKRYDATCSGKQARRPVRHGPRLRDLAQVGEGDGYAVQVADLPFEVSHAGLARIPLRQCRQALVGERDLLIAQSRLLHLLLDEEALGDLQLLQLCIAG